MPFGTGREFCFAMGASKPEAKAAVLVKPLCISSISTKKYIRLTCQFLCFVGYHLLLLYSSFRVHQPVYGSDIGKHGHYGNRKCEY